jgi:hypothetical protein
MRVFEKRVLGRIFGPKKYEIKGELKRLDNAELYALYSSSNIFPVIKSRRMRWVGHVVRIGTRRGVYRVLVGRPDGKKPLGRSRRRREYNIKMDPQEVGWGGMAWTAVAQDRDRWQALANEVINLRVP